MVAESAGSDSETGGRLALDPGAAPYEDAAVFADGAAEDAEEDAEDAEDADETGGSVGSGWR